MTSIYKLDYKFQENDVRDHFFSGQNMNFTYGIIRQEVNSKCGYDIDKSPKLKTFATDRIKEIRKKFFIDGVIVD